MCDIYSGTPGYVAPDILNSGVREGYPINVDMFSVGVVAYTLLCGYEPFFGSENPEIIIANKKAEFKFDTPEWTHISNEAKDFITQALKPTAAERLTTEGK